MFGCCVAGMFVVLVVLFGFLVAVYLLVEFVWFVIVFVCYGVSNDLVCGLLVLTLCVFMVAGVSWIAG